MKQLIIMNGVTGFYWDDWSIARIESYLRELRDYYDA